MLYNKQVDLLDLVTTRFIPSERENLETAVDIKFADTV